MRFVLAVYKAFDLIRMGARNAVGPKGRGLVCEPTALFNFCRCDWMDGLRGNLVFQTCG